MVMIVKPQDTVHFYSDSSSHRGHQFMVVGGVAIRPERVPDVNATLQKLKDASLMKSEFKWSKYRGGRKKEAYVGAIDLFFSLIDSKKMNFHTIICDFKNFDHKMSGVGNPEKSVNKLYYQLMLHNVCRTYGKERRIQMFPDHGNDSSEIVRFRDSICAASYNKYDTIPNCLRSIHPTPSKKHNIIQMVDLVIGGIAANREGRKLAPHKHDLQNYILGSAPVSEWSSNTSREIKRFTVWNFTRK